MKYKIIVYGILLILSACSQKPDMAIDQSKVKIVRVTTPLKRIEFLKYSELYDKVKLVQLETSNESLIGRIDKIVCYKDKFFILDQGQRKGVLAFDINGKFIRKFGNIGNGKGKFNMPNDISIINDKLAIWVSEKQKFIIYDINGKFLKEVRTANMAKSGTMLDDDEFALYLDIGADANHIEKYNVKFITSDGNVRNVAFKKEDKEFSKGNFFFNQGYAGILLSPGYSNEIYTITKNQISKSYKIDFGKSQMPKSFPEKFPNLVKFEQSLAQSDYATLLNYNESDNYLTFNFVYKTLIYSAIYSKQTKVLKYGNMWFNDVGGILPGVNKGLDGNAVIAYFDPAGITYYHKNYNYPIKKEQIKVFSASINGFLAQGNSNQNKINEQDFQFSKDDIDRLKTIKPTDNPVLLIQNLKKF